MNTRALQEESSKPALQRNSWKCLPFFDVSLAKAGSATATRRV